MPKQPKNLEEIVKKIKKDFREKNAGMYWRDANHCSCIMPPEGAKEKYYDEWIDNFLSKSIRSAIRQALEGVVPEKWKGIEFNYEDMTIGYNKAIDDFNKLKKQFLGEE